MRVSKREKAIRLTTRLKEGKSRGNQTKKPCVSTCASELHFQPVDAKEMTNAKQKEARDESSRAEYHVKTHRHMRLPHLPLMVEKL